MGWRTHGVRGRDHWYLDALSDVTLTPLHLGLITQLNDSPCSCMHTSYSAPSSSLTYKVRREDSGWGWVKGVTWSDLLLESYLKSPSAIGSRSYSRLKAKGKEKSLNVHVNMEKCTKTDKREGGMGGGGRRYWVKGGAMGCSTCSAVLGPW